MKSYSVSIDPDALNEIKRATNWYNTQSPGLGDRFQSQVFLQIDSLMMNPRLHAVRRGKIRSMTVKGFAFIILFIVIEEGSVVKVQNVIHKNTNPDHWPRA